MGYLIDMLPRLAVNDHADVCLPYAEHLGDLGLRSSIGNKPPHFSDRHLVKFGIYDRRSPLLSAVKEFVGRVVFGGVPAQVFWPVIGTNAIVMTSLCPGFAGANKGEQNAVRNRNPFWAPVIAERDIEIPSNHLRLEGAPFDWPLRLTAPDRHLVKRPYLSQGRRFVSMKSGDWFPNFGAIIRVSHGVSPHVVVRAGRCCKQRFRPDFYSRIHTLQQARGDNLWRSCVECLKLNSSAEMSRH